MIPNADRSVYRRRIDIEPSDAGVTAEMEDHHHHFRVVLQHDGVAFTAATATGIRAPWETCGAGGAAIGALVGITIDDAADPRTWGADRSIHCTHVDDLALLAVRHARGGAVHYRVRVWPAARAHRTAVLERNGVDVMRWDLDGRVATFVERGDAVSVDRDEFLPWIRSTLDADGIEQAMILRRATSLAIGNAFDLDDYATAVDVHPADETCHTYRAEIALTARRVRGSSRPLEWT